MFLKIAQKVTKCLGSFCKTICQQDVSKIAQSGNTAVACQNAVTVHEIIVVPLVKGGSIFFLQT